jgi:hypothetical protein
MCHFVTATLPSQVPHAALDELARNFGRCLRPLASPSLSRQLPAGTSYFLTTVGHCDCGTLLGSVRRAHGGTPDWAAEEAKLVRKGWSKGKATRAVAQRRESEDASLLHPSSDKQCRSADWPGFVAAVLQSKLTPELGLLLHSYRGPLDEEFVVQRLELVPTGSPVIEALSLMEEDVLYVFRAEA